MEIFEGKQSVPTGKIAVVVSKFNKTVTESLLNGCLETLKSHGVPDENICVAWVPGAFELPTVAGIFCEDENFQAVICLGCVIRGETPHDRYICRAVSTELARLGTEFGLPVIFGLLTCLNNEQALARAGLSGRDDSGSHDKTLGESVGNKGVEAAEAALEMIDLFTQLPHPEDDEEDDDTNYTPDPERLRRNAEKYRAGGFDIDESGDFGDDFIDDFDDDPDDDFEETDSEEFAGGFDVEYTDAPGSWGKHAKESHRGFEPKKGAKPSFGSKQKGGKKPFAKPGTKSGKAKSFGKPFGKSKPVGKGKPKGKKH